MTYSWYESHRDMYDNEPPEMREWFHHLYERPELLLTPEFVQFAKEFKWWVEWRENRVRSSNSVRRTE